RVPTPIGEALVVTDAEGVLRAFNWRDYEAELRRWLGRRYAGIEVKEGQGPLRPALNAYFGGDVEALAPASWIAVGTTFQQTVWKALCSIPAGETLSYSELATRIGRPSAVRAVGLANRANPVALFVPCHRVIGS